MGDEIVAFLVFGFVTYFAWFRAKDYRRLMRRMYPRQSGSDAYMKSDIYLWLMRIIAPPPFMVFGVVILMKLYGPK